MLQRLRQHTALLFLLLLISGCQAPSDSQSVGSLSQLDSQTQQLLDSILTDLKTSDWESLRQRHWSEMQLTADALRELFEPMVVKMGSPTAIVEDLDYTPMTKANYENYMDPDELPGPAELLKGEIEFTIQNEDGSRAIVIWAHLCEVDGKTLIFDYIEVFPE